MAFNNKDLINNKDSIIKVAFNKDSNKVDFNNNTQFLKDHGNNLQETSKFKETF